MNTWKVRVDEPPLDDTIVMVRWTQQSTGNYKEYPVETGHDQGSFLDVDFPPFAPPPLPPKLPPTVTVTQPVGGSIFPDGDTVPITFRADARDADGTPLSGASIKWDVYLGTFPPTYRALGQGEQISSTFLRLPLDVSRNRSSDYNIRVTANGASGESAEDSVWITIGQTRDAQFLAQSVPDSLVVGQGHDVTLTFRNIGNVTWRPEAQFRLGSQSPQDNTTWGLSRVPLLGPVAPLEEAVFTFAVTAPTDPGVAYFQWQILQEGVEWFGQLSQRIPVRIFRAAGPTVVPDVTSAIRRTAADVIRTADLVPVFTGERGELTVVDFESPAPGTQVARGTSVFLRMTAL